MHLRLQSFFFFFFNDTATTEIYTLSLHDALPISSTDRRKRTKSLREKSGRKPGGQVGHPGATLNFVEEPDCLVMHVPQSCQDRKSTRLNSSHDQISYAVFCLKKKKK